MSRALTVFVLFLCLSLRCLAQQGIDFVTSVSGGCSPLIVTFSPLGVGADASYRWDFGNGNTSTIANPQAIYNGVWNYPVTLTVSSGGRVLTAVHTVTVYGPPTPAFTASASIVCGTPVVFTSESTAADGSVINSYVWDFGDGATSRGGSSVSHQFAQGQGSVNLTVVDDHGCSASVERANIVTTLAPLVVRFAPDQTFLCNVSDAVHFTNTSTGPGTLSYAWDFGDGTSSIVQAPGHNYAQAGTYSVKLTAMSSAGCTVSNAQADLINVDNYHLDLVAPAAMCTNAPAPIYDASTPTPTSRVWSVNGAPLAQAGQTFFYSFPGAGSYTIGLTDHFGNCVLSTTKTINIGTPPPYTPFTVTTPPCGAPGIVTFTDNTPGATSWSWNIQGGSAASGSGQTLATNFASNGGFSEYLTVGNAAGCYTQVSTNIQLSGPIVNISETDHNGHTACDAPITKSYTVSFGNVQTYNWEFWDGATSSDPNPTHTFTNPGDYLPILHYTTTGGCTGSTTAQEVQIGASFSVDVSASPTTTCTNSVVKFTVDAGAGTTWVLDFGDGSSSTNVLTHSYGVPGVYTVTLTARNAGGCTASKTKTQQITVTGPSATYAGHVLSCANTGGDVTFSYPGTNITGYQWDFGDGTSATTDGTVTTQHHTYTQSRVYFMSVTATSGQCQTQVRDQVPIMIHSPAVLSAPVSKVCSNASLDVVVTAQRNDWPTLSDPQYDYSFAFEYSDGSPFLGIARYTQTYAYGPNGLYNWTLSGFDPAKSGLKVVLTSSNFNCTQETNTIPLTIPGGAATPRVTVVSDDQCFTTPVVLKDASVAGTGNPIVGGTWDFGDGRTQALVPGASVSHVYADPGQYSVKLTVLDAAGCSVGGVSALAVVDVNGPKAAFTSNPSNVLLGNTVFFSNASNTYGSFGTTYGWDFGDGGSTALASPSHLYAAPGLYPVTLTASDGGCQSTAMATLVVKNFNSHFQIAASYVTRGSCPPVLAQFVNTSVNYTLVAWDFGDGTTAGNTNTPSHVYTTPGAYQVTLFVYGAGGLTGQYTDSVFVRQPWGGLSALTPVVCVNQAAQLQASGKGVLNFAFDYGDGFVSAGLVDSAASHVYTVAGDYQALLVVTDTVGCSVAADARAKVAVNPLPTILISPADAHVCLGSVVELSAAGASGYVWSPGGVAGEVLDVGPVVNTRYQVLGTDDNGCQGSASVDVKVVTRQTLRVSPDSTGVCQGDTVSLHAKGTDVYQWMGAGLSSGSVADPVAQPIYSAHYVVVGSDAYGCFSDTAQVVVTVKPLPLVNGGGDVEVLQGEPVVLAASGSNDIVSWQWAPPDYLSCTDCAQPVSAPKKPANYVVTVFNGEGCHARDTVHVKLLCVAARVRIPEGFSPNGDGHNDRWAILGIGFVDHIVVYDRWGIKVFERDHFYTADLENQWDGTFNGQPVATGVYVYFVQMSCPSGGGFIRKGTIVLVR